MNAGNTLFGKPRHMHVKRTTEWNASDISYERFTFVGPDINKDICQNSSDLASLVFLKSYYGFVLLTINSQILLNIKVKIKNDDVEENSSYP